jgi:alpha-L-fucosidase
MKKRRKSAFRRAIDLQRRSYDGASGDAMTNLSRRAWLELAGAGMALAAQSAAGAPGDADRERRMQWWHQAKFGMFIHWGLYSVLGRHEWAMEEEGIPVAEYQLLAQRFTPQPHAARAWARLARQAGQKYMVMTTKHHEGFCLFDTRYTDYCAPKQACGRDLVKEFVAAARGEGLRVGFYYSLMDWHHPDGARCAHDEAARRRFVDYIHGQIRELMTHYGKIDILWYDVAWPLDATGWESGKMNQMVFELQPDIIVNNRNLLPGDFSTPEQHISAAQGGRAWETCMTMNDSWGYQAADDAWKSPKRIVRNLVACARDGGNYLLNIGPRGDGSVPEESVRILTETGQWMEHNGHTIYESEPCRVHSSEFANFTRKGNTLYMHVHFWPGETVALGGLKNKVLGARLLTSGKLLEFQQEQFRVRFTGLPKTAPDHPVTVLAIDCDSEPEQDTLAIRRERRRLKA